MDASFNLFSILGIDQLIYFLVPPSLPIQILVITDHVTSHRGQTAEAAAEMRENKLSIFRAKLSLHQHHPSSGLSSGLSGGLAGSPSIIPSQIINRFFCNIMSNVFSSPSGRVGKLPFSQSLASSVPHFKLPQFPASAFSFCLCLSDRQRG